MKRASLYSALFALALLPFHASSGEKGIRIGTGDLKGTYNPVGHALCRVIAAQGIPCEVVASEGSVDNLAAIRDDRIEFGLTQSDTQYLAYKGSGNGHGIETNKRLRAVFSVFDEPYTLVVRPESKVEKLLDVKGKRVNLSRPGSGERETNRKLMERLGWRETDFAHVAEAGYGEQDRLFCGGELDVTSVLIGHPNPVVEDMLSRCNGVIVPVVSLSVHTLVNEYPYYTNAVIHAGTYPQITQDIPTFGVKATLVTSSSVPETLVYAVTRAVFTRLDQLRAMHPALKWLQKEEMIQGNTAPFHPGALRYLREAKLLAE